MKLYSKLKHFLFTDQADQKNVLDVVISFLFMFLVGSVTGAFFIECFRRIIVFYFLRM